MYIIENMKENKLHLLYPEKLSRGLYISKNAEQSLIANGDIIVSERTKAFDRPMHCSELSKRLQNRRYNKAEGIFVRFWTQEDEDKTTEDYPNLFNESYNKDYVDDIAYGEIDTITYEGISKDTYIQLSTESEYLQDSRITEIEKFYKELFGTMTGKEIYFYNTSKKIYNILDNTTVIDLITPFSDTYTDTVSLSDMLKLPTYDGISSKVDLSIQYTKEDKVTKKIDIYGHDTSFQAFRCQSGEIEYDNFVEDINSDVRLEYINNIIKISPLDNDIIECIINKCEVIYGKL